MDFRGKHTVSKDSGAQAKVHSEAGSLSNITESLRPGYYQDYQISRYD